MYVRVARYHSRKFLPVQLIRTYLEIERGEKLRYTYLETRAKFDRTFAAAGYDVKPLQSKSLFFQSRNKDKGDTHTAVLHYLLKVIYIRFFRICSGIITRVCLKVLLECKGKEKKRPSE